MNYSISKYAQDRDNNFNLLRFIAAYLVLYSHSYALALGDPAAEPPRSVVGMSWGNIAVDVFFITSGFLIANSFFGRNNIIVFTWARILRIFPALFVSVILCVLVLGPIFTSLNFRDYIFDLTTIKFLIKNSILVLGIEYRLPEVFTENPMRAVNGSLWTLPFEITMYFWLAVFGSILVLIKSIVPSWFPKLVFSLLVFVSALAYVTTHFEVEPLSSAILVHTSGKFAQLFYMFFLGSAFYLFRHEIYLSARVFYAICALLFVTSFNHDAFFVCYSLTLPYVIFFLAYVPSGKVRQFNQFGDYSYGMYIYAYPVQQTVAALIPGVSVWIMIVYSSIGTFVLAYLSWHFVEKNALQLKGVAYYLSNRIKLSGLKQPS